MSDLVGKSIGPYRLVQQVGAGGMATVYKAYQPGMDRYVAIKILPPALAFDEQFAKRFKREARALAGLEHAHILPIYDHGQQDDLAYLVMRYIESGTLRDLMDQGMLGLEQANRIIGQMASALDYAHQMGIVHRDIKPANILIDARGDAYLTDFGVAHILEGSQQLTESGVGIGTPAYMAPEQGQGLKVDHRSDIYALGVVLYEMLTGRVPFQAETPLAIVLKHIHEPLPLPRAINPNVPEEAERVILKALAKDPVDRFQTAGELARALALAVGHAARMPVPLPGPATRAAHVSLITRAQRAWARPRLRALLLGVALLALVAGGWLLSRIPYSLKFAGNQVQLVAWQTPTTGREQAALLPSNTAREAEPTATTTPPAPTSTAILPGMVLFEEDFEDGQADGLTETGVYWQVVSDENGNKVYEVDTRPDINGSTIKFGLSSWADYILEYRVKMLNPDADIWVGFRDGSQGDYVQRLSLRHHTLDLYSSVSGTPWQPLAEPNYNVAQGVWYLVRIEVQGEIIRIYVDGDLRIEKTDSQFSVGGIAIGNLGNTHAQFDDIRVTALEAAATATPTSVGTTYTIAVPANAAWFNTGVEVRAGQPLTITASGTASIQSDNPLSDRTPNGDGSVCTPECLMPGAPFGALIGKIADGEPFKVGAIFQATTSAEGTLFLAINDDGRYYFDNSGSYDVTITLR